MTNEPTSESTVRVDATVRQTLRTTPEELKKRFKVDCDGKERDLFITRCVSDAYAAHRYREALEELERLALKALETFDPVSAYKVKAITRKALDA